MSMRALLPDAPNPQGWPYRLVVTPEETAWKPWQEGIVTHAISIMPPGQHHFRLREMLKDRAMVWLPFREGRSLPQVVDDELAYIEHFVDALPEETGLVVFSKILGAPALAVVMGLLARQVGWERASALTHELRATLVGQFAPSEVLVEAWKRRLG